MRSLIKCKHNSQIEFGSLSGLSDICYSIYSSFYYLVSVHTNISLLQAYNQWSNVLLEVHKI